MISTNKKLEQIPINGQDIRNIAKRLTKNDWFAQLRESSPL